MYDMPVCLSISYLKVVKKRERFYSICKVFVELAPAKRLNANIFVSYQFEQVLRLLKNSHQVVE